MSYEVEVEVLPHCDLCKAFGQLPTEAEYDAKTLQGPWAFMCDQHWRFHGVGCLGTGYGQRLVLKRE